MGFIHLDPGSHSFAAEVSVQAAGRLTGRWTNLRRHETGAPGDDLASSLPGSSGSIERIRFG